VAGARFKRRGARGPLVYTGAVVLRAGPLVYGAAESSAGRQCYGACRGYYGPDRTV